MPDSAIVHASESLAGALVSTGGPLTEEFTARAVVLGAMTPFDVAALAEIVLALPEGTLGGWVDDPPLVAEHSSEGPWLYRLPPGLGEGLRTLPAARIPEVARAWVESLVADSSNDDLRETVTELGALAVEAGPDGALLLWCEL